MGIMRNVSGSQLETLVVRKMPILWLGSRRVAWSTKGFCELGTCTSARVGLWGSSVEPAEETWG